MAKWIMLAVAVGALLIFALWKLTAPAKKAAKKSVPVIDASVEPTAPTPNHKYTKKVVKRPRKKSDAGIKLAEPEKLHPKSQAFNRRIDVGIADRLRAHAAKCYSGGHDPDAKLKIFYRLRIENGAAWVTDLKLENHGIPDKIARCMVQGVQRANWKSTDMPDYTTPANDPEMLFVRLRALKKYKHRFKELR